MEDVLAEQEATAARTDEVRGLPSIAKWAIVAAVAAVLLINFARYAYETQDELRLIPWLEYSRRVDFGYFYAAGEMVYHGDASDLYPKRGEPVFWEGDPAFTRIDSDYEKARLLARGNYYNPPGLAATMAPFAALSFRDAFWLFSGLSAAALGAFCVLALLNRRSVPEMPLFVLGVLAFKPVHEALIMGHPALFFALSLGAGFLLVRSGRQVSAGLVLSVLALKPQWAVLPALFLLVQGQWRAFATMAVASAAIFFLPFLVTGPGVFKTYTQFLQDASSFDLKEAPHMFSWNGFLWKLDAVDPPNKILMYGLVALTLVPLVVVWRSRDFHLGVAATVIAMLLVSLRSIWYDWSFLIVAGLFLLLLPMRPIVRVQAWVVLLALYFASSQSVAAVVNPAHHYIDWYRSGFFSLTLVAFGALAWMAGVVIARDGVGSLLPSGLGRQRESEPRTSP